MAVRQVAVGALAAALLAAGYTLLRPPVDSAALATSAASADDEPVPEAIEGVRSSAEADDENVRTAIGPADEDEPPDGAEGEAPPPGSLQRWVEDLRDDDVRGNAGEALWRLRNCGKAAVPALEGALGSLDLQQRHLAAEVLRQLDARPSAALCRVSVEALGRDLNAFLTSTILAPAAVGATRYLARHAPAARDALRFGLGSADDQQRFLCAFLLACGGEADDGQRVLGELVRHLADNEIRGDAVMAAHGLFRLGRGVRPNLQAWLAHVDEQARSILQLVVADLADAEAPLTERPDDQPSKLPRVTRVYTDPARHYDVRRSRVPTW